MCGIFGIVTKESQNLGPILIGAGERLSYRGYDTVGAATVPQECDIDLRKDAGKVQEVAVKYNFKEMSGDRAIVTFELIRPILLRCGTTFVFREGKTRGFGRVCDV